VVAHNAADCWPAHSLSKHAGTITVRICPPIATQGRRRKEINALAYDAMTLAMASIGPRQMSKLATDNALDTMKSRLGST